MKESPNRMPGDVEVFPKVQMATELTDRLNNILEMLRSEFPDAKSVSLEFNGRLFAHIDVRNAETIPLVEAKLTNIGGGMFSHTKHGPTPNHPFHHRISAIVER